MIVIVILCTLLSSIAHNLSSQNELYGKKIDAIYFGFIFSIIFANLTNSGSQYLKAAVRKLSTG